jgi:hypothetical protein
MRRINVFSALSHGPSDPKDLRATATKLATLQRLEKIVVYPLLASSTDFAPQVFQPEGQNSF